jgi:hypothetical protein
LFNRFLSNKKIKTFSYFQDYKLVNVYESAYMYPPEEILNSVERLRALSVVDTLTALLRWFMRSLAGYLPLCYFFPLEHLGANLDLEQAAHCPVTENILRNYECRKKQKSKHM